MDQQAVANMIGRMEVKADAMGLLTHYRDDLVKHDRMVMERMPEMDFVWLVSETSSDVYPIGVHPRAVTWFEASIEAREKAQFFLVSPRKGTIKSIARDEAKARMRAPLRFRVEKDDGLFDVQRQERLGYFVFASAMDHRSGTRQVHYDFLKESPASVSDGLITSLALYESEARFGIWIRVERKSAVQ